MPFILFYSDNNDRKSLLDYLNNDPYATFVVSAEKDKWKGVNELPSLDHGQYTIWFAGTERKLFNGAEVWHECSISDKACDLYWGKEPLIFYLNISDPENSLGFSSFYYDSSDACKKTKDWWSKLQRWFKKNSVRKISRTGDIDSGKLDTWAMQSAFTKIESGMECEDNPPVYR